VGFELAADHLDDLHGIAEAVAGAVEGDEAVAAAENEFRVRDERFSLYQEDSEASRIARGELPLTESSQTMRDAYAESLVWRDATAVAFTPHRPDGVLDLSGTIKADALRATDVAMREAGVEVFSVNAGGDLVTAGFPDAGEWITGIAHPLEAGGVLSVVSLTRELSCLATSGTAERGEHIWNPKAPDAIQDELVQVTVISDDLVRADVWATAAFAEGPLAIERLNREPSLEALFVFHDGRLAGTDGLVPLFAKPD
jgi:thiamine biosynthesis lipoprotein